MNNISPSFSSVIEVTAVKMTYCLRSDVTVVYIVLFEDSLHCCSLFGFLTSKCTMIPSLGYGVTEVSALVRRYGSFRVS